MACTCTEDKEVLPNGVIIGRNRVTCQECLDNADAQAKAMRKQELLGQIKDIEGRILYSMIDGDTVWVEKKKAERLVLKNELKGL